MSRKSLVLELVPILHGHGWTQRQIGVALKTSQTYVHITLRDLGIIPPRPHSMAEATRLRLSLISEDQQEDEITA